MLPYPRKRTAPSGFTLVELVVVIAIIAILAGAIVPSLVNPFIQERRLETMKEMAAIEEGIMGRPDLGDWGFLSTLGDVPVGSDTELLFNRRTGWATATYRNGVPRGWNGPYVRSATRSPDLDAWGSPYQIVNNQAGGDESQWRIISLGPNRVEGPVGQLNDDIFFPSSTEWYESEGTVNVTLLMPRGGRNVIVNNDWIQSVTLNTPGWATNGAGDATQNCPMDPLLYGPGQCRVANVPFGLHSLTVVLNSATTGCVGANCTLVRPVKVLKPSSTAEVVLPTSAPAQGACFLDLNTTASPFGLVGTYCNAAAHTVAVPPGASFTVSVVGLLVTTGAGECMLTPAFHRSGSYQPSTAADMTLPSSATAWGYDNTSGPVSTSRTFTNTSTGTMNVQAAVRLWSENAPTSSCFFGKGSILYEVWLP